MLGWILIGLPLVALLVVIITGASTAPPKKEPEYNHEA
jgi:hypothetical protein